jgi:hypothetical protein
MHWLSMSTIFSMIPFGIVRSEMKNGILARFLISPAVKYAGIICGRVACWLKNMHPFIF